MDVILVSGDAYLDHPAFPAALLGRVLEAQGYRVGIIARPDFKNPEDIARLGLPRLFFGVTAGCLDSLVGNYTAQKRRRSDDPYAPGGKAGGRPDRALTVYGNLIRQAFGKSAFIVAGGLEASLRRFAHYDFWSDSVRRPILMDCGADVLVHGMGEGPIVEIADRLKRLLADDPDLAKAREAGRPVDSFRQQAVLHDVPGVVYRLPRSKPVPENGLALPDCREVVAEPKCQARAYTLQEKHRDRLLWQDCSGMRVVANPPWPPLSRAELDRIYALPFSRDAHPAYKGRHIPALDQVRFAVTSHRGCFGGCSFCAIGAHQGRTVTSRSRESVLDEIRRITAHPEFRGTITDLGGPSANMYGLGCLKTTQCKRTSCLWPKICRHLNTDQTPYLNLLTEAEKMPGVKHLFVTTGIRTDLAVLSPALIKQLALKHTSGQMKVAPEHVSGPVLQKMHKTTAGSFLKFLGLFREYSQAADKKQYVLPYLMAAHPGCQIEDMQQLSSFLIKHNLKAEQCQIFTPTPGTAATVMYATGLDPTTLEPIFVERDLKGKEQQKSLILHHLSGSKARAANAKRNFPRKKE